MNKTSKILFVAMCIFAFTFVSVANAANSKPPKPSKILSVDLVWGTSPDSILNVVTFNNGAYQLTLDANPDTWYFLDVLSINLNPAPLDGIYFFYFIGTDDPAFWGYWETKGVFQYTDTSPPLTVPTSWQEIMSIILAGYYPMFMLKVEAGDYMLIDGLQLLLGYSLSGLPPASLPLNPLRLNGDYPEGIYKFMCSEAYALDWTSTLSNTLGGYIFTLQITNPNVIGIASDVSMVYWTSMDSTLYDVTYKKEYQLTLDRSSSTTYYLDVSELNSAPYNGYYWFYLVPPTDTDFWDYWAAKGVTPGMSIDGTWQSVMSKIIDGTLPIFMLRVENGDFMLVDGLQLFNSVINEQMHFVDAPLNPLRLNGDYPEGIYNFVCQGGFTLDWKMEIQLHALDGYTVALDIR